MPRPRTKADPIHVRLDLGVHEALVTQARRHNRAPAEELALIATVVLTETPASALTGRSTPRRRTGRPAAPPTIARRLHAETCRCPVCV